MVKYWLKKREWVNQKINESFRDFFVSIHNGIFDAGKTFLFSIQAFKKILHPPSRYLDIVNHLEFIGNQSILIIVLTGGFTGLALSYQIYSGFSLVNATNLVGPTVALGIFKELAPVLTGLIVAARAGGAMAARLGTMRVTEQIDALEVMGIDPIQYLISPRILAALIATPLLCGIFDFVAIYSADFLCTSVLDLDQAIFWDKIENWIQPRAIVEGLIKATVFGATFSIICTKTGFYTTGGAKGVGDSTNKGVVFSMVMIIILNFFTSNIIRMYFNIMDGM